MNSILGIVSNLQVLFYVYLAFVIGYLTYDKVKKYNLTGLDNYLSSTN